MTRRNGSEHECGMDALQKWTLIGVLLFAIGAVLWRLGIEQAVK